MVTQPNSARAHVLITGHVQGVGYRVATQRMAQRLAINGWVRNLIDGRVEAVFEGPASNMAQAIAWCYHGPNTAVVKNVAITWHSPQKALGFTILPTADLPTVDSLVGDSLTARQAEQEPGA